MPKQKQPSLTWRGNLRAEEDAEVAFRRLKYKPKKLVRTKKISDRKANRRKGVARKRVVGFRERGTEPWWQWYSAYLTWKPFANCAIRCTTGENCGFPPSFKCPSSDILLTNPPAG